MNNVYIIGDLHGSFKPIRDFYTLLNSSYDLNTKPDSSDTIICLGDFGGQFSFDYRDRNFKKKLGTYKFTYFIIRGNHEERASIVYKNNPECWQMETYFGSSVMVEKEFPYIKYASDMPFKYEICGRSVLTLPGAYSVDKYYRLSTNNKTWFANEQMSEQEKDLGRILTDACPKWDLVLSHTCPSIYIPSDLFLSSIDQSTVDNSMERYLGEIENKINYKLWTFGHYHALRVYPKYEEKQMVMLFNEEVIDLNKFFETNDIYQSLIKIHI